MFLKGLLGGLALLSLLVGPAGCGVFDFKPRQKSINDIPPGQAELVEIVDGYDWSLPSGVRTIFGRWPGGRRSRA